MLVDNGPTSFRKRKEDREREIEYVCVCVCVCVCVFLCVREKERDLFWSHKCPSSLNEHVHNFEQEMGVIEINKETLDSIF